MNITTEQLKDMLLDITLGRPAPPDEDAETRKLRTRMTAEVAQIKADGGIVDIPPEMPDAWE